jgi:hypothetical protein
MWQAQRLRCFRGGRVHDGQGRRSRRISSPYYQAEEIAKPAVVVSTNGEASRWQAQRRRRLRGRHAHDGPPLGHHGRPYNPRVGSRPSARAGYGAPAPKQVQNGGDKGNGKGNSYEPQLP